jgi:hypothetical protein
MRHALILRALSLPLAAALFICGVLVAMTPYSRFSVPPEQSAHQTIPVSKLAPASDPSVEIESKSQPGVQTAPDLKGDEATSVVEQDDEEGAVCEYDNQFDQEDTSDEKALITSVGNAIGSSIELTAARLNNTISSAAHQITVWRGETSLAEAAHRVINGSLAGAGIDATELLGGQTTGEVVQQSSPNTSGQPQQVELLNRTDNTYPVAFLLNDQRVKLEPGEDIASNVQPATVRYDRGGGLGTVTRSLTGGHYEFRLTTAGWDLIPTAP